MKAIDLTNPEQNKIFTLLTIIYYGSGDVKDIWDDLGDESMPTIDELPDDSLLKRIMVEFEINTEDQVAHLLEITSHIYENYTLLQIKTT